MSPAELDAIDKVCAYLAKPPAQMLFPGLTYSEAKRSPEKLSELLRFQKVRCAVCGRPKPQNPDHDHETGLLRGLLCISCNRVLGLLSRTSLNAAEGWRAGKSDQHPPPWYPARETLEKWMAQG